MKKLLFCTVLWFSIVCCSKTPADTASDSGPVSGTGSGSGAASGSNSSSSAGSCTYKGHTLYRGSQGGCYYYSGNTKEYVDRSYCSCL